MGLTTYQEFEWVQLIFIVGVRTLQIWQSDDYEQLSESAATKMFVPMLTTIIYPSGKVVEKKLICWGRGSSHS